MILACSVITSLLFAEDSDKVTYKQEKLREYLIECFTAGELLCWFNMQSEIIFLAL